LAGKQPAYGFGFELDEQENILMKIQDVLGDKRDACISLKGRLQIVRD